MTERRHLMSEPTKTPAKAEAGKVRLWNPQAWFAEMEADMGRMLSEGWPFARPLRRLAALPSAAPPRVDMYEQNGSLVVKAELPGVKKDDMAVTLEGGDLVIKGERKEESEIKEDQYYRMERFTGSFYRRLPLPEGTQPEQISAEYKDGVLEVRVPKPAAAQTAPTKIGIK
jgi:HSP20 family protein